jgi:hypothetical protein
MNANGYAMLNQEPICRFDQAARGCVIRCYCAGGPVLAIAYGSRNVSRRL